ncbi:MAG: VOC family protein, partial [Pseudomonadota bacterium]
QLGEQPMVMSPETPAFGLSFETEDVPGSLDRAVAAGAELIKPIVEQPWGQTTCSVSDPDGYLIEICSAVTGN